MKTYLVGGAVRDKLLGLPVKDRDWVVIGATPKKMIEEGFEPIGENFPVFLHPKTNEEYALARTERKSGKGYKGFVFYSSPKVTLEDDLKRRDLTINAIAEDENGELIDPYGGEADLKNGILRHVSPAFVEDPLRVLRIARFAACFGFKIADETIKLLHIISKSNELDTLTPERVWSEMEKALAGKYPTRFILALRSCNALKILFPEIDALFGIPQDKKYHPEIDVGRHTLMALNQSVQLSSDPIVRFSVLVHDLGKATTPKEQLPNHDGHETRGINIIDSFCERYKIPNKYHDLAACVSEFHIDCHQIQEMEPKEILERLEKLDAFRRPERFKKFLIACESDSRGRAGFEEKEFPQAKYFLNALEISRGVNVDLLANKSLKGKELGEALRKERIKILEEALH